jgi:hypothetical protein
MHFARPVETTFEDTPMAVPKPFKRTCRQFSDGTYSYSGKWMYVLHPQFAKEPEHFVRALQIIQKDILDLFDYIEAADTNLECYSYRIHALHMRTCIEVEANCKAILEENGYSRAGYWNMCDYQRLGNTHHLSAYEVRFPVWRGSQNVRKPFASWSTGGGLGWYQAYNAAKHDRHDQFPQANFRNLLDAVSGLVALLSAQFHTWDFSPSPAGRSTGIGGPPQGFDTAIGNYFHVRFPTDWSSSEQYDFDWQKLQSDPDPFQTLIF